MNGPQDVGGLHGFGAVIPDADEAPFHAQWEERLFALTLAMGATGAWNLDQSRAARESIGQLRYRQSSYYQIWLAGLLALLYERGLVTPEEVADGRMRTKPVAVRGFLQASEVSAALSRGAPADRPLPSAAAFSVGDRVRTKNMQPLTHTRLPGYIRNRTGRIAAVHGAHLLPDEHATSGTETPVWLYSVCFDANELFGPETTADCIYVDCWESYLLVADCDQG